MLLILSAVVIFININVQHVMKYLLLLMLSNLFLNFRYLSTKIIYMKMERKKGIKLTNQDTKVDTCCTDDGNQLVHDKKLLEKDKLKNDKINIAILFFLYVLQGIPLGLAGSIPMILQNRNVSYKDQALFSFVSWPFSVKLLWAPLVDSLYFHRFGRRKTWLIPTQYLIGLFMIILSSSVSSLLGDSSNSPNVFMLTVVFFCMNFLAATQDIAVDGWALTMLSR